MKELWINLAVNSLMDVYNVQAMSAEAWGMIIPFIVVAAFFVYTIRKIYKKDEDR